MIASKKITMYGVFKTYTIFGQPARSLLATFKDRSEADGYMQTKNSLNDPNMQLSIGPVTVIMPAWDKK